jgi:sulfite exporter TauE/SafE
MNVLLGTVFVASLLGSLHCVGMCGPFALLAGSGAESRKSALMPTMAYSVGRLISYTIVGAIFGALGLALNTGGSFTSWQQSATFIAGASMIAIGFIALARCLGFKVELPKIIQPIQTLLQRAFTKTAALPPISRAATIGALSSLMPCGWLYTFAIAAAGTGSPFWGAIVMTAFWAGTVPIMAALMLGFGHLGTSIQKHIPVTMAVVVIAVGVFTIVFRAPVAIAGEQFKVVNNKQELIQQINSVNHGQLPCCQCGDSK